jgi:hypothetical protein
MKKFAALKSYAVPRLKPKVAQKPADEGLFGDESQQTDLVDMARKPPKSGWTEIGKNEKGQTLYEDERGVRAIIGRGVQECGGG